MSKKRSIIIGGGDNVVKKGRPQKTEESVRLGITIPKELYNKLQDLSGRKGQSVSALIRLGVMEHFKLELEGKDEL